MSQQTIFIKEKSKNQASIKTIFIVAEEFAKSAWPFTEGKFAKACMIKVCNVMCPDNKQAFF